MGKERDNKTDDLELSPDKADEVKGGVLPSDPGGTSPRKLAVKHHTHKKNIPGPSRGMGHK